MAEIKLNKEPNGYYVNGENLFVFSVLSALIIFFSLYKGFINLFNFIENSNHYSIEV
jgi:hypothetical protein